MGLHFDDWVDYNGVFFNSVSRMGSHIFGFFGGKTVLSNILECLCCRLKIKCFSFHLKNGSIHKNRK